MNFDSSNPGQRPYPRPRPNQPSQPPSQGDEGMDPAALIAARTAAVARNRAKSERASLIHDALRIVGVLVLIGGAAGIAYVKHRNRVEEERLAAEHEAAAQAARAKERAEADARAAARREAERAAEAEIRKKEEERREAAARKAEAERQRAANVKRYDTALKRFNGTSLELLSAAPPTDLPVNVIDETWYSCVVPGGQNGTVLYEVKALPGKDIHVTRLESNGDVVEVPLAEFNGIIAKSPFLMAKGSHCYYNGQKKWVMRERVPDMSVRLDPSRVDLRDLYKFASINCGKRHALTYEVFFRDIGGVETRVLSIPFGGAFGRNDVIAGIQKAATSKVDAKAVQARLNEGSLVIRRKGGGR